MIFPFLIWLSIITATATTQVKSCEAFLEDQLIADSSLEFMQAHVIKYENSFSIMLNDDFYTVDYYFTPSQEEHINSLNNGYHPKDTCQIDHQEFFISKMRITNKSI